ncbi:hypothetical protein BBO99_00003499 [Phytophthora kernoviae]|uniref:Uncharacterized protein n=2 Tax=Phytophthora kernoviae TaxID=325452 RepID=A0A3R7FWS2_9STRA|nr:hypothetical protein G195_007003 [Phytophthora kernoviae 00238/432]KAG2529483.1 hypothetical protein JM18_002791 [Phytophthora kernoviae]RLN02748.1 hypothetical protein BBI17_003527 [Phytophthora kernoviae]RLN81696.1 hypothetical protein BBO99_00003499 [Phytophthora kernoviae]
MEEPVLGDEEGQQQNDAELFDAKDDNAIGNKAASDSPEANNDAFDVFDTDVFASMMQQELIAYKISWDPLMKVLYALRTSMAKQQQSNNAAMKKMEDQVIDLRDELACADNDKKEANTAMEKVLGQMEEMRAQLEDVQRLSTRGDPEKEEQNDKEVHEEGANRESEPASVEKQSPRLSSTNMQSFVTAKELADVKNELSEELKKALAQALGRSTFDEANENEDADNSSSKEGSDVSGANGVDGPPGSARTRGSQLLGGPFASAAELQAEVAKLNELQAELNTRVNDHDQRLDALQGSAGKMDELCSRLSNPGDNSSATTPGRAVLGDSTGLNSSSLQGNNGKENDTVSTSAIMDELKELKVLQEEHDQKLRDHDEAVEKHTADIKALADSLDDLSVQQQTVASMYAPRSTGDAEDGKQNASADDAIDSGRSDDRNTEATEGEPTKDDREEEYTRKLRYLDEEVDAMLQVNITTEKKNDPLIKGLDAMREKLELLWSMWHRNYNADRNQASGSVADHEGANTNVNMTGHELDSRVYNTPEGQKQFYDNFIKEVTKKVTLSLDKGGNRGPGGPGIGGATNASVNYRLLLDNFAQKVDDRLEDAREFTAEEMARLRRELLEQLKLRFEVALRDLRGELMILQPIDGDSTAMGTKPVMCVACSRPVPVSSVIREAGSLPLTEATNPEPTNSVFPVEYDYTRPDDEFVFRAGFKMPANDRKVMTLPFLTNAVRSKMVLNKPEGKRKRPIRQSHLNRVDNVVREALELDRVSRGRGLDAPQ